MYTTRNIILEKLISFLIMVQMISWQSKSNNDHIYIAFIKKNIVVIPNEKIIINHETI